MPEGQTLQADAGGGQRHQRQHALHPLRRAPTSALYDATYTGPLSANLSALIPSTKPGTYYILVQGFSGPAAGTGITLLAEELPW